MWREQLSLGSVQIGETADGGFNFTVLKFTASVDPASIAANTIAAQTFTIAGLVAGDLVVGFEQPPAWDASAAAFTPLHCDTADSLEVKGINTSAGAVDVPAGSVTVTVLRLKPFA